MSCLDVWVAAFDRLSDALEDYVACCQSVNEVPTAAEEITGVDDSTGAPEYDREADEHPTEYADSAAYDAYLCGVAHRYAEKTDGMVDTVYDIIRTTSNILVFATLVVLAFANIFGMAIAAVLFGGYTLVSLGEIWGFHSALINLRDALGGGDPQGLVPQTKAELNAVYDDIVDAIFCANDAPAATAALHAVLDANVTNGSYRALLKLMNNSLFMRAAFAGFVNVPDRFDCDCDVTYIFFDATDFGTGADGTGLYSVAGENNLQVDFIGLGNSGTPNGRLTLDTVNADPPYLFPVGTEVRLEVIAARAGSAPASSDIILTVRRDNATGTILATQSFNNLTHESSGTDVLSIDGVVDVETTRIVFVIQRGDASSGFIIRVYDAVASAH